MSNGKAGSRLETQTVSEARVHYAYVKIAEVLVVVQRITDKKLVRHLKARICTEQP